MNFNEFVSWLNASIIPDGWRTGQHAFNMLYQVRPDIADEVRGVYGIDPFNNNNYLPEFFMFVEERW